ncbi:hypothetical protein C8T65DRAFT_739473 [Cerioporus squamosus]|nr:hypothetical protein C8T65DRAFT_739473 [Cerioporus squamosus]
MPVDISEDALKAELEQLLQEALLLQQIAMADGYLEDVEADSDEVEALEDGEDDDDEGRQPPKSRRRAWVKPGPSPLRRAHTLEWSIPVVAGPTGRTQATRSEKRACVRTPCRDLRINMQIAEYLGKLLRWPEADPLTGVPTDLDGACTEAQDHQRESSKTEAAVSENDVVELSVQSIPMGNGTPRGPCFSQRQTLHPPPSQYQYSVRDRTLLARRFTQSAFFGNESWCTLLRIDRAVDQSEDIDNDRVVYTLLVGAGDAMRVVDMRTDCSAMELWREHEEHASSTLWDRARGETTGSIIEETRLVHSLLVGRGGTSPGESP